MKLYEGCDQMIFCIKKLYLCISWYFFIIVAWVLLTEKIAPFLLCLSALGVHELGHIAMICIQKEKISIFYILPFGFCCRLKNQNKICEKKMLKILLSGPVTSFCVAGLFTLWTKEFAMMNFIIGLFNLLPIGELDGSRIMKSIAKK